MTPTPKVAATAVGGSISIIAVWLIGLAGMDVPAVVASAFTTLASFAAGWFTKDGEAS